MLLRHPRDRKLKMAAIFENISKSVYITLVRYLGVENFDEIALSPTVKEIEAILCFTTFGENSKWPPFFFNFPKVGVVYCLHTLGVENFNKITLSLTLKETEATLCFSKIRKFKMAAIFEKNSKVSVAYCLDNLGILKWP